MTLDSPTGTQTVSNTKDWRSILQAVLSFLGALWMFAQAILLIFIGIIDTGFGSSGPMLTLALVSAALGVLLIPSGITALIRIKGQPIPAWLDFTPPHKQKLIRLSLVILPLVLFLGWLGSKAGLLSMVLVPFFGLLGISLPIVWLLNFGMQGLKGGSAQRKWGLFGISLTLTTGLIILVEILAAIMGIIVFILWASLNPEISNLLTDLSQRIMIAGQDFNSVLRILEPYITKPSVIFIGFLAVSIIVPLIEEILKTLGVWFLVKRKLSPTEGFVAGLICGAGFALVEGFFNLGNAVTGADMVAIVFSRIGASLIHISTGGLIGWGLTSTWRTGKFFKYLLAFLTAFFIHSIWNLFALGAAFLPMVLSVDPSLSILFLLPILLLGAAVMAGFIIFTIRLRKNNLLDEPASLESMPLES